MQSCALQQNWIEDLEFTEREIDILSCLTEYQSSKKIAKILNISYRTVETHIFNITQKMRMNNRIDLIELLKRSDDYTRLKNRFSFLYEKFVFEEYLLLIKTNVTKNPIMCYLQCDDAVLKHRLENDCAKLNIICLSQERYTSNTIKILVIFKSSYPYTLFSLLVQLFPDKSLIQQAKEHFKPIDQRLSKFSFKHPKKNYALPILMLLLVGIFGVFYSQYFYVTKIRFDFAMPIQTKLLSREKLLKQIKRLFQDKDPIKRVVLVGIGGVGKTILARQYMQRQHSNLVWELNAEKPDILLDSFTNMAYSFCKNPDEKHEIEILRKNSTDEVSTKKLIYVIKTKLKKLSPWSLIFDSVEDLASIKQYLPFNAETCGSGEIIITTRQNNIADNDYIKQSNVIVIPPLSEDEKYQLFNKLQTIPSQNKKAALNLLKQIPPFPLDIVVAAGYFKDTCADYLLAKSGVKHHQQVRFMMIDDIIQGIIKKHPKSVGVLLFVSQLGSQNIPKSLLNILISESELDQIIRELAKHSLITYGFNTKELSGCFSVHKSTQENIFNSISKLLGQEKLNKYAQILIDGFEDYCLNLRNAGDLPVLRHMIYHLKVLHKSDKIFSVSDLYFFQSLLGSIYLDLGYYDTAKTLLDESFIYFQKQQSLQNKFYFYYTAMYLAILDKETNKCCYSKHVFQEIINFYQNAAKSKKNIYYANLAQSNFNFIQMYFNIDRLGENLELVKNNAFEAIRVYQQYGSNDLNLAQAYVDLATFFIIQDKEYANGQFYLEKGMQMIEKTLGNYSPKLMHPIIWLSTVLRYQGQYSEALKKLKKIYKFMLLDLERYKYELGWCATLMAENYRKLGQLKQSEFYINEATRLNKLVFDKRHLFLHWNFNFLAKFYTTVGRYQEAIHILQKSLQIHLSVLGPKHFKIGWIKHLLGSAYLKMGNYEKAYMFLKNSLEIYEQYYGRFHYNYALVLKDYGFCSALMEQRKEGIQMIKEAEQIFIKLKHPSQKKCRFYLSAIQKLQTKGLSNRADA